MRAAEACCLRRGTYKAATKTLQEQFGSDHARIRKLREKFMAALCQVHAYAAAALRTMSIASIIPRKAICS